MSMAGKIQWTGVKALWWKAASKGCTTHLPLPLGRSEFPPNTWILGSTRVHIPNWILISSATLAQLMVISNRQTQRYTKHRKQPPASLHSVHAVWSTDINILTEIGRSADHRTPKRLVTDDACKAKITKLHLDITTRAPALSSQLPPEPGLPVTLSLIPHISEKNL